MASGRVGAGWGYGTDIRRISVTDIRDGTGRIQHVKSVFLSGTGRDGTNLNDGTDVRDEHVESVFFQQPYHPNSFIWSPG